MKDCLEAVEKQSYEEIETIIIDNASSDGSVELLKEAYPWVRVAVMPTNLGFAGGVNVGIRLSSAPYVLLLNNDTKMHPDFVKELVAVMESSEDIFSVCGKMIQYHNQALLDDAGDLYTVLGWAVQRGVGQKRTGYNQQTDVFSSCAGAGLYRKSMLNRTGLFDESHFAYLEDIDLGYRARIMGFRNVYCPTAQVLHVGSATSGGTKYNSWKVHISARNSIYVPYKNMPLPQLLLNALPLAAGCLVKWNFFRKLGFGDDYIRGIKDGITGCRKCKKVFFKKEDVSNYVKIEWDLWKNTGIYVYEFLKRRFLA